MNLQELQLQLEKGYDNNQTNPQTQLIFNEFKEALNNGTVRAATKNGSEWQVNQWVKKGILIGFRLGKLIDYSIDGQFKFFDKDTYPLKRFELNHNVRQVPGGSSVRDGSYVAPGVVIMPPAYINVGAFVDTGSMVDSHALVGSCAQIGKNVHLSAGAQIGGVLEPIGSMPVIIEDNVMIGGNSGIFDGTMICEDAVIGAGTVLTGSTPVFDLVKNRVLRKAGGVPLTIPPGAVVVQGSRAIDHPFARQNRLSINTPLIIKYKDDKTAAVTELETSLR